MPGVADRFAYLDVNELADGDNVRFALTEIEDLAADIRRRGVLQPIVVIPTEDGAGAEVLVGHRRLAAAKVAGLTTIPCILRIREIDTKRLLDQIAENTQRVQLTPIEEATACRALADQGYTPVQIGQQMRKSDTWVNMRLKLLTLPQCLQDAVHAGTVTVTRALDIPAAAISTPGQIENLCRHLNDEGLGAWWRDYYSRQPTTTVQRDKWRPPTPPPGARFTLTLHFDEDTTRIFDALVKASSVFTKKADVVNAMLDSELAIVRDNMQWDDGLGELETLRHLNGMTAAEEDAYDEALEARVKERGPSVP